MGKLVWECIADNTYRLKINSGWLIRYHTTFENNMGDNPSSVSCSVSMVFVPFNNTED